MNDPIVIDPPDFDQAAAWKECREFVDKCGGLVHDDGKTNWKAASGADPGICSCPACQQMYWMWGRRQKCKICGFVYPTDAWPMFSWGVQAGRNTARERSELHEKRLQHPYYSYGFEHSNEYAGQALIDVFHAIDWRKIFEDEASDGH